MAATSTVVPSAPPHPRSGPTRHEGVILFTLAAIQFVGLVVETVLEDSFYGLIADVCERCKDSVCRKNDDVTASPAMKTGVTSPLGKLSKAFREPPRWPRGPLLRRENRHRWG